MAVQFKIPKLLQEKTSGATLIEVRGSSVRACIADLTNRYPGLKGMILDGEGRLLLKWMVYINDRNALPTGELSHRIMDGDIIALLPMVAGG